MHVLNHVDHRHVEDVKSFLQRTRESEQNLDGTIPNETIVITTGNDQIQ